MFVAGNVKIQKIKKENTNKNKTNKKEKERKRNIKCNTGCFKHFSMRGLSIRKKKKKERKKKKLKVTLF